MMNHAVKNAFFVGPKSASCCFISISFFHSTPVLEKKRRTNWNYGRGSNKSKRPNYYMKTSRVISKKTLLQNMSDYADHLFQSWKDEDDTAWFRRQYWSKGAKLNGFGSNDSQWGRYNNKRKGSFNFCASDDDDDDIETIFRAAFGGQGYYYWSFDSSENFQGRNPSGQGNRTNSGNWRYETDEEVDSSQSDLASERLALGLKASGPLQLEELKTAYRACALRWHPDRHQGSSKAVAEEKFKHCSAAYKSLCEKLAVQ